jgi:succinate dehydrogenase/fumarate reductase flavoprotein subunit
VSEEQGKTVVSRTQCKKEDKMTEEKQTSRKLTRRDFVKGAAAVAGVGALASCAPAATPAPTEAPAETPAPCPTCAPATECPPCASTGAPETWDQETDVVVVGSGHCGALPCAIEAARAGAEVIVLEKNDWIGGLSKIGGDSFTMGGNNYLQQEEGVVDDDEAWYQDELWATNYRAVPEILRALIKKGPDTCLWLRDLGLEFALGAGVLPPPIKRGFTVLPSPNYPGKKELQDGSLSDGGPAFTYVMMEEIDRLGVPVLTEHRVTKIYREPDGPVLGVQVDTPDGTINIKARKAVHLGTGPWTDNYRMVQAWDPRAVGPDCYGDGGTPFNGKLYADSSGDGFLLGEDVGAGLSDMSFVAYLNIFFGARSYWAYNPPSFGVDEDNYVKSIRRGLFDSVEQAQYAILVKNDGVRWINEAEAGQEEGPGAGGMAENPEWTFPYTYLSLPQPRNVWVVTDSEGAVAMGWDLDAISNPDPEGFWLFDPACLAIADTLAELASQMNVPAAAFEDTVNGYNGFVDAGNDEDFGKPMPMYKIATPPFYAAKASVVRHTTRHGLRVNTKSQVLERSDQLAGYSGTSIDGSISIDEEKVIPHLYAAGEAADVFGWRRVHNSVGHYISASRTAGENAVQETAWG